MRWRMTALLIVFMANILSVFFILTTVTFKANREDSRWNSMTKRKRNLRRIRRVRSLWFCRSRWCSDDIVWLGRRSSQLNRSIANISLCSSKGRWTNRVLRKDNSISRAWTATENNRRTLKPNNREVHPHSRSSNHRSNSCKSFAPEKTIDRRLHSSPFRRTFIELLTTIYSQSNLKQLWFNFVRMKISRILFVLFINFVAGEKHVEFFRRETTIKQYLCCLCHFHFLVKR